MLLQNTHEPQEDDLNNVKQPLIYAMIDQPNFYFSQQCYDQKLQVGFLIQTYLYKIVAHKKCIKTNLYTFF